VFSRYDTEAAGDKNGRISGFFGGFPALQSVIEEERFLCQYQSIQAVLVQMIFF
jgi:hypothetical protein